MDKTTREKLLELYTQYEKKTLWNGDFFPLMVVISLGIFIFMGIYLSRNTPPVKTLEEKIAMISTSFIIEDKKTVVTKIDKPKRAAPKPKPEVVVPKEPIDLTKQPVLSQKQNEIIEETQSPQQQQPAVRRVYGLRRVYSTGLGSGGGSSDAIIGKIGNTLNTEIDTFKATKEEIKGKLVSITTITTTPKILNTVKPEYTKEMIDNKIEGVVQVKMLIDTDGKVKQVIVLNDLGFGAKEKVHEACLKMEFEPAKINDTPVAVWFQFKIRFELLN
jgi:protein TonB